MQMTPFPFGITDWAAVEPTPSPKSGSRKPEASASDEAMPAAEALGNFVQILAGTDKPAKRAAKLSLPLLSKLSMLRKK